ncbi:MAG: 50S ribosomal protein L22 [Candidatus Moranbacteria bacterium]|nr:50S ribosomal protein L22 [Candidatus Moranbacteria bacterium]
MQVTARLNNLKIAPRKVRLVAHVIKGMSADAALVELSKQVKRSSEPMSKLLRSAIANAEHNFGIDPSNLFVRSVLVGDGKRLKRWQPRAFGRANQILHRLSNVSLVVEERIEGLNRKEVRKAEVKKAVEPKKVKETEGKTALASEERKETKKDSSVKQEMKERKNAVKRVYQRKSI